MVLSLWTPETGYMVELQHANNLLSVYKGLSQSLVTTGQTIRAGEMVGYNAEAEEGEVRLFEFELWNNGKPVDLQYWVRRARSACRRSTSCVRPPPCSKCAC